MGVDVMNQLKGATYDERCEWILNQKATGNELYKNQKYDEAMDAYLKSLCGFAFEKKEMTEEQIAYTENEIKVPVLNNLAICLMKKKNYDRAVAMLDQALKINSNFKSLLRKAQCFVEMTEFDKARPIIKEIKEIATESKDRQQLAEVKKLEKSINSTSSTEKEFTKNIFQNGSLYNEKRNLPTKEEEAKMKEEMEKLEE